LNANGQASGILHQESGTGGDHVESHLLRASVTRTGWSPVGGFPGVDGGGGGGGGDGEDGCPSGATD